MKEFKHIQTAHCENGAVLNLFHANGLDMIDEPMAFGIGSGLFYIHIPFLKINDAPAISFRMMPGHIFKQTCKLLKVDYDSRKYRSEKNAKDELDELLSKNISVGLQVGVFNLPYFPVEYRFHFNAHNIVVHYKDGDSYIVSDSVMENPTILSTAELTKVRFAKGLLAPKGHLYYMKHVGLIDQTILKEAVIKGIKRSVGNMLHIPGNFAGVKGLKYTAKQINTWRDKFGVRKAGQYLGQIVRMQEEIGTGGGGFRFIYAAFMQQASELFENTQLLDISEDFTNSGDLLRNSAVKMAGVYRGRATEQIDFSEISEILIEISEVEKKAFTKLSKLNLKAL